MDIYGNKLVNIIEINRCVLLYQIDRHVNHGERMDPIDFGGQKSNIKVTMDIYGNKIVNMIATKPLCASRSNLVDMLVMVRG